MENPQQYYLGHGPMTANGARSGELSALPTDLGQLCDAIQGVLIHSDMTAWLYDVKLPEMRVNEKHIRPLAQALTQIRELAPQPLNVRRGRGSDSEPTSTQASSRTTGSENTGTPQSSAGSWSMRNSTPCSARPSRSI